MNKCLQCHSSSGTNYTTSELLQLFPFCLFICLDAAGLFFCLSDSIIPKTKGKAPFSHHITDRHRNIYRHLHVCSAHFGAGDITVGVKICFIQGAMEHLRGIWDLENSSPLQGRPCYQGAQLSINVPQKLNRLLEQQLKHCGQWILRGWQNTWNPVVTFYSGSAAW